MKLNLPAGFRYDWERRHRSEADRAVVRLVIRLERRLRVRTSKETAE